VPLQGGNAGDVPNPTPLTAPRGEYLALAAVRRSGPPYQMTSEPFMALDPAARPR